MQRILLVEENLRSRNGHWFQFAYSLKLAERDADCQIEMAAGRSAGPEVVSVLGATPVFSRSRLDKGGLSRWRGLRNFAFLWHNWLFYRELLNFLKEREPFDIVFFPTASHYQLFAISRLQRRHPNYLRRAAIFFVQQPTWWPMGAQEPRADKIAGLLKLQLARFRGLQQNGRTVFAVETSRARQEFEDLAGIKVGLWPHPVAVAVASPRAKANGPVIFGSFGFARHEKGSDLIAAAIESALADARFAGCQFVIQWGTNFQMPDGSTAVLADHIRANPRVRVIDHALDEPTYLKELHAVSALLLPYRKSSYYGRLSRISIEAAAAGIPMIATPGTHLEEVIREQGAGIVLADESPEALVAGMAEYLSRAGELHETAARRAPVAATANSAGRFLEVMRASFT
jgi:glycosyltransferase involved in cell wall biosynthesis